MTDTPTPAAPAAAQPAPAQPAPVETSASLPPDQAKARISELRNDQDFAKRYLAGDKAAVDEMTRLHQQAEPPEAEPPAGQAQQPQAEDPPPANNSAPQGEPLEPEIVAALSSEHPLERAAAAVKIGTRVSGALQDMGTDSLPPHMAEYYSRALVRALESPPSPQQIEVQKTETITHLQRTYGADKAAAMVKQANAELDHIQATSSRKDLRASILAAGAGNDVQLIVDLANRQVERAKRQLQKAYKK